MELRSKQPQGRQRAPQQIHLFAKKPQNAIGNMLTWSMLTADVQAALTGLMT